MLSGLLTVDELFLHIESDTLVSNTRTERMGGREYLVKDATILVEGVLNGSDGPLFYPESEISLNVGQWNGIPLTARHPMATDPSDGRVKPVSARDPRVMDKYGIGYVYNDRMEGGRRRVDAWFDVQNCEKLDPRIIPLVRSGKAMNISTGIVTRKQKAVNNASHKGKGYTHSVHNIRPDHLAVLLDERGACSVGDGCGININRGAYANAPEECPHCGARLEIDPDSGICNRCGKKVQAKPTANVLTSYLPNTIDQSLAVLTNLFQHGTDLDLQTLSELLA